MNGDLHTTNLILSVMAGVAILECLVAIALGVVALLAYRRVMALAQRLAATADHLMLHELPPLVTRVNAILDDVKGVSAVVTEDAKWADRSVRSAVNHIDEIRSNVRAKTRGVVTAFRALRFVFSALAGR